MIGIGGHRFGEVSNWGVPSQLPQGGERKQRNASWRWEKRTFDGLLLLQKLCLTMGRQGVKMAPFFVVWRIISIIYVYLKSSGPNMAILPLKSVLVVWQHFHHFYLQTDHSMLSFCATFATSPARSDCVFRVVQPATWVNALSTMTNASGKGGTISFSEKDISMGRHAFRFPFKWLFLGLSLVLLWYA